MTRLEVVSKPGTAGRDAGPDVAAIAAVNAKKPVESDFKNEPGYYQREKRGGGYKWGVKFKPNDGHGKLTHEAERVQEIMLPFMRADSARMQERMAKAPRVEMLDATGAVQYLDPAHAEGAARRSGWSHRWRVAGLRLVRGIDGRMDFRLLGGRWEPTGYRLTRGERKSVPCRGLAHDPDGQPWRGMGRSGWVRA